MRATARYQTAADAARDVETLGLERALSLAASLPIGSLADAYDAHGGQSLVRTWHPLLSRIVEAAHVEAGVPVPPLATTAKCHRVPFGPITGMDGPLVCGPVVEGRHPDGVRISGDVRVVVWTRYFHDPDDGRDRVDIAWPVVMAGVRTPVTQAARVMAEALRKIG